MGQLELIYVLSTSFSVNPVAYVSSSFPSGREGQAGAGGWGWDGGGGGGGAGWRARGGRWQCGAGVGHMVVHVLSDMLVLRL